MNEVFWSNYSYRQSTSCMAAGMLVDLDIEYVSVSIVPMFCDK